MTAGLASASRRTFHARACEARSPAAPAPQRARCAKDGGAIPPRARRRREAATRREGVDEADDDRRAAGEADRERDVARRAVRLDVLQVAEEDEDRVGENALAIAGRRSGPSSARTGDGSPQRRPIAGRRATTAELQGGPPHGVLLRGE